MSPGPGNYEANSIFMENKYSFRIGSEERLVTKD